MAIAADGHNKRGRRRWHFQFYCHVKRKNHLPLDFVVVFFGSAPRQRFCQVMLLFFGLILTAVHINLQ